MDEDDLEYDQNHVGDGSIGKYMRNSWLVGSWKEGIYYEDTLSPMARYTSIMALAAKLKWNLHQMDVKTTFRNGVIKDEVYMEQSHVYIWKKALYGLEQVW